MLSGETMNEQAQAGEEDLSTQPQSPKPREAAKRRRKAANGRPKKPYPEFPLTPHASGAWQKKIRGKIHYFGKWAKRVGGRLVRIEGDGWKNALEAYKAVADDLHAGRTPRVRSGDELHLKDLCNAFLTAKQRKVASGELTPRAFMEYREVTDMLVAAFGKTRLVEDLAGDDFEALRATMAERWGPVRLCNGITRVKSVFKYGFDNGLIRTQVRYGGEFKKPDKSVLRRARKQAGEKMLEADQLRRILDALAGKQVETDRTDPKTGKRETVTLEADPTLRAMTLLGLNAAYGNNDCATMPMTALDLTRGWLDYPRPKTAVARRCPLWPETVEALRTALAARPAPKDAEDARLVFVNSRGAPFVRTSDTGVRSDVVTAQFTRLLKALGMHRAGIGFYTLRHVARTIGDRACDHVACDVIMGHSDPSMASHYRERVEDGRLQAVVDHVRRWLLGPNANTEPKATDRPKAAQKAHPKRPAQQDDARPALRLFVG
jgi:integrase